MFIRVGYDLEFDLPVPAAMTLLLNVLPERGGDLRHPDRLRVQPDIPVTEFVDWFGNRAARLFAPAGRLRLCNDTVVEDSGLPIPVFEDAVQHPVQDLPPECLQFLLPSRYCEVDLLSDIAWDLFDKSPLGWGRVQAICDWVNNHIEFGYAHARPTKTAMDVYNEKKGVCRDFTHLALTLCRAMNIPARYATGYLGDIGVPLSDTPMDFSACFQCFLGGRWHTFDARHNARRIGWILMATGRDAADCAITTTYGPAELKKFVVWTDEVALPELSDPRC